MTTDPTHDPSDDVSLGDESSDDLESENTMVFEAVEIPPPPGDESSDDSVLAAEPEEDSDEADNAIFDESELARAPASEESTSEESASEDFGGPDDASEEQPFLVVSPSDEAASLQDDPDPSDEFLTRPRETPLRGAYEYLEIRTPIAEFESYARARTEALVRLGDSKDAEIAALAMNLGTEALRRVMGALPKETL